MSKMTHCNEHNLYLMWLWESHYVAACMIHHVFTPVGHSDRGFCLEATLWEKAVRHQ